MAECVALIVASGRGQRFGAERPKQWQPLARTTGAPALPRALLPPSPGRRGPRRHSPGRPRPLRSGGARARSADARRRRPDPAGFGPSWARKLGRWFAGRGLDPRRRPAPDRYGGDRPRARRPRPSSRGAARNAGDGHAEAGGGWPGAGHGRALWPLPRANAAGLRLRGDPGCASDGRRRRAHRRRRGRRGGGPRDRDGHGRRGQSQDHRARRPRARRAAARTSPAAAHRARIRRPSAQSRRRARADGRPPARPAPPDRPLRCRRRAARGHRCAAGHARRRRHRQPFPAERPALGGRRFRPCSSSTRAA